MRIVNAAKQACERLLITYLQPNRQLKRLLPTGRTHQLCMADERYGLTTDRGTLTRSSPRHQRNTPSTNNYCQHDHQDQQSICYKSHVILPNSKTPYDNDYTRTNLVRI